MAWSLETIFACLDGGRTRKFREPPPAGGQTVVVFNQADYLRAVEWLGAPANLRKKNRGVFLYDRAGESIIHVYDLSEEKNSGPTRTRRAK